MAFPRRAKPTITDVGKEAGVSQTAVSYVLSGSPYADRLKPETRERVLEAAKRLGYTRNSAGAALKRGYSDNVVLLVVNWNLATDYADDIVAISRAAGAQGLSMNVLVAADDTEGANLLGRVSSVHPYGLIVVWDSENLPVDQFVALRAERLPIIDLMPPRMDCIPSITADRAQGWFFVTKHLIELGHRNIGFIMDSTFRSRTSSEKLLGYQRALETNGISQRDDLIEEVTGWGLEGGYQGFTNLITRSPDLTAVVCINDQMALGAIAAARELDVDVPGDVSIASGGASREGAFFRPKLTTAVHADESTSFAEEAVRALSEMRSDPETTIETVYKPMKLIVRESTGPAKS